MTTINTVEDFIRVMDSNPEFLEAVRSRLLTRELLELPQRLEQFIEAANRRFDALETGQQRLEARQSNLEDTLQRFIEKTDQRLEALEAGQQRLEAMAETANKRLDALEALMETANRRLDALEAGQQRLEAIAETANKRLEALAAIAEASNRRLEALEGGQTRLEGIVRSMHTDVSKIRGFHAYQAIRQNAWGISRELGFRARDMPSRMDLWDMIDAADAADISHDELVSFTRGDLIVRATDAGGEDCYLAVEVSFTVHRTDRIRAMRNARFLTRFTGKPAYAVVAGLQINDQERERVRRDQLIYYEIKESALEPD